MVLRLSYRHDLSRTRKMVVGHCKIVLIPRAELNQNRSSNQLRASE